MAKDAKRPAEVELREDGGGLCCVLRGNWTLAADRPQLRPVLADLRGIPEGARLRFDAAELGDWDSALLILVRRCRAAVEEAGGAVDTEGLPEGARRLLRLSQGPTEAAEGEAAADSWFGRLGMGGIAVASGIGAYFQFVGQLVLDLGAFARGDAKARLKDFLFILQQTGPRALGIVCLLSFLTGLIIAFIGVIQLQKFAADIYVADLVGLATTRELGAVMTGVIMAGRTGAAFAAQIGSMQVNEEIDALTTFGISPGRFLVVPRVVALVLMMPLLCAFSNFVAIFGGMVVAMSISDVSALQYFLQVEEAVGLNDFFVGIFKSAVFGAIIALAGCYRGLHCGRDAGAVGLAATSAVVTAITWIVVADAVFAVLFHNLGI